MKDYKAIEKILENWNVLIVGGLNEGLVDDLYNLMSTANRESVLSFFDWWNSRLGKTRISERDVLDYLSQPNPSERSKDENN